MANEVLDVRGKICPVPLLLTKRKLESLRNGEVLEVRGDFPQTRENIEKLVQRMGNVILKVDESEGQFRILIRKNTSEDSRVREKDLSCKSPK